MRGQPPVGAAAASGVEADSSGRLRGFGCGAASFFGPFFFVGAAAEYRLDARLLGSPFRCAECRRPYAGWHARLVPQAAPPELRRAITRARFGS